MRCPFCNTNETQVKDSRISDDGDSVKRRRYCNGCNSRFTTTEKVQLRELFIIKKSKKKQKFDVNKLRKSIQMAVRKRPVSESQVDKLVNDMLRYIEISKLSEIESRELGELVMKSLKSLDKVAFVRFASVYKNFETADDFKKFIGKVITSDT